MYLGTDALGLASWILGVLLAVAILASSGQSGNAYGYQDSTEKGGIIQELLSWNFSYLNPDGIVFGNAMRVMTGPSGHSLKFDGSSDYVKIESPVEGKVNSLVVSAWVKPDYNFTSDEFEIAYKPESFSLSLKHDAESYHAVFAVTDGAKWYAIESKNVVTSQWTHIVAIFDTDALEIYINDVQDSTIDLKNSNANAAQSDLLANFPSDDILIGASANGIVTDHFFSGLIDDVRVVPNGSLEAGGILLDSHNGTVSVLPNATSAVLPNATSAVLPNATSAVLPNATSAVLPNATSAVLPNATSSVLPNATSAVLPNATSAVLPNATSAVLPNATSAVLPNATSAVLPNATSSLLPKPIYQLNFSSNSTRYQNVTVASNEIGTTELRFAGNGYVSESIEGLNQISNLTVSLWVYPNYTGVSNDLTLLSKKNEFLLNLGNNVGTKGIASFSVYDGVQWHTVESTSKIPQDWTHIAATFNGASIAIYVNGILENSLPISKINISATGQIQSNTVEILSSVSDVVIGSELRDSGYVRNPFSGVIGNLTMYDKLLDAPQIRDLYKLLAFTEPGSIPISPVIAENFTTEQVPPANNTLTFNIGEHNDTKSFGDARVVSSGINGSSLDLSGRGFVAQNITSTNQISSLTLSAWVKPDYQKGSSDYTIMSKDRSFLFSIHNHIPPAKIASFSVYDGVQWHTVESTSKIPQDWTHIAATFNGTNIAIYVNGKQESNIQINSVRISLSGLLETKTIENLQSPADVIIGAQESVRSSQTEVKNLFGGQMDEVNVYNELLKPDQIKKLYVQGLSSLQKQILPNNTVTVNATAHMPGNVTGTNMIQSETNDMMVVNGTAIQITPSIAKFRNAYLITEKPTVDFEFLSDANLKKANKTTTEGVHEKQSNRWTGKNSSITVDVFDPSGNKIPVNSEFTKLREGKFNISLSPERAIRAGHYVMKVTLTYNDKSFVTQTDYSWGLVSLNTNKSIFRPSEPANFTIVVLDNGGHPVCNADMSMTVTNPTGSPTTLSSRNGILASSECGLYVAQYVTGHVGNYTVSITAKNPSGVATFSTSFLVQDDFAFDITRTAQSKIDPVNDPNSFYVKIDIASFVNPDNVVITETIPSIFNVTTDANIEIMGDAKVLTWNKNLVENHTSVWYTYSVPLRYPQLYALGPVHLAYGSNQTFAEARPWFVAVDPGASNFTPISASLTGDSNIADTTNVFEYCSNKNAGCTPNTFVTKSGLGTPISTSNNNFVGYVWLSPISGIKDSRIWGSASGTGSNTLTTQSGSFKITMDSTTVAAYDASYTSPESIGLSDGLSSTKMLKRTMSESLSVADTITSTRMLRYLPQESLGLSDNLSAIKSFNARLAESIGLSDVESSTKSLRYLPQESLGLSDGMSSTKMLKRTMSESIVLSDTASSTKSLRYLPQESLGLSDGMSSTKMLKRTMSESMGLSDTVSFNKSLRYLPQESLGLSDGMSSTKMLKRTMSESIVLSDTASSTKSLRYLPSESLRLSDSLSATKSFNARLAESISLSDALVSHAARTLSLTDLIMLDGTSSATASKSVSILDHMSMSDLTSVTTMKSFDESMSMADMVSSRRLSIALLNDTIGLTDGILTPATRSVSDLGDLNLSDVLGLRKTSADQYIIPDNQTTVNVSPDKPNLVVTSNNTSLTSIIIPSTVTSSSISYSAIVSSGTVHLMHALNITKDTNGDGKIEIVVTIPALTDIHNNDWNGILQLPTVQTSSSLVLPIPDGQTATAKTEIGLGSSLPLTFNNATRILFVGESGHHAGFFYNPESVREITQTCSADNQSVANGLPADGSCKVNVGSNLVVWTRHFTGFVTWTLNPIQPAPSSPTTPSLSGGGYGTGVITGGSGGATGITSAAGLSSSGVMLYDVTYDVCDKQNVRFTVGTPDRSAPSVRFATANGVVEAKMSSHQPYAGLYDLAKQNVLSYDATLKPGTKTFNMLIVPENGTGYVTAKVDVTKCMQTVTFAPLPIIGQSSPNIPKIFDVKLRIGNNTGIPASETQNEYVTNQTVSVSGLISSPVTLAHAEIRVAKVGGNESDYSAVAAQITPSGPSGTYLVSAILPHDYLASPAVTYWVYVKNSEGYEAESDQYSLGVSVKYAVSGTIGFVMPQNVPAGLSQSPQVYFTNNSTGILYGTISLVVDGKQVSQFVDHVFARGTSVMGLNWDVPAESAATGHSVRAIATFYGHTFESDVAKVTSYPITKTVSLARMEPIRSFTDGQGNTVATPQSVYASFASDNATKFHVVSPGGQCVIGDVAGCIVDESTYAGGGRYSSVTVDGTPYSVYYSGTNSPLQRFTLISKEPITGDWRVTLEKNGTEQKELESNVYLKIKFEAMDKQLLVSLR